MKMTLDKILCTAFLLITITLAQKTFANAAQPGIWNAGGTVYTMLYPEDANTFKKIQMQQERIFIQLYKGFAVVKGTYVFKNTTNEHLQFKMGYPINGIYSGGENDLNQIILDSLSQFKIKANNKWLLLEKENHPDINNNTQNINAFSDNWKVWQMQFAPNEIQKVEVYFIVNTNEARIRKGYNIEKRNAFIYDTEINIISIYSMLRMEVQARYKIENRLLIFVFQFFCKYSKIFIISYFTKSFTKI